MLTPRSVAPPSLIRPRRADATRGARDKSTPAKVSVRQRATARFTPTATKFESSIGDSTAINRQFFPSSPRSHGSISSRRGKRPPADISCHWRKMRQTSRRSSCILLPGHTRDGTPARWRLCPRLWPRAHVREKQRPPGRLEFLVSPVGAPRRSSNPAPWGRGFVAWHLVALQLASDHLEEHGCTVCKGSGPHITRIGIAAETSIFPESDPVPRIHFVFRTEQILQSLQVDFPSGLLHCLGDTQ